MFNVESKCSIIGAEQSNVTHPCCSSRPRQEEAHRQSARAGEGAALPHCTVLYCTVLYCTALHCTALYCTVLVFRATTPGCQRSCTSYAPSLSARWAVIGGQLVTWPSPRARAAWSSTGTPSPADGRAPPPRPTPPGHNLTVDVLGFSNFDINVECASKV